MLGPVGVNDELGTVRALAEKAFNWQELVLQKPKRNHLTSLVQLYSRLKPLLQHTSWPVGRQFQEDLEIEHQYHMFVRRIREAAAQEASVPEQVRDAAQAWFFNNSYAVRPVIIFPLVKQMLMQKMRVAAKTVFLKTASIVSVFLGECDGLALPDSAFESIKVKYESSLLQDLDLLASNLFIDKLAGGNVQAQVPNM